MKFTKENLKHLANLAKIELTDEELESLVQDLNKILDYIEEIEKLGVEEYEPIFSSPLHEIILREDKVEEKEIDVIKQILSAFPKKEGSYLKVPKIIEKE